MAQTTAELKLLTGSVYFKFCADFQLMTYYAHVEICMEIIVGPFVVWKREK